MLSAQPRPGLNPASGAPAGIEPAIRRGESAPFYDAVPWASREICADVPRMAVAFLGRVRSRINTRTRNEEVSMKISTKLLARLSHSKVQDLLTKLVEEADDKTTTRIPDIVKSQLPLFKNYLTGREVAKVLAISERHGRRLLSAGG
jgi:hypothetical protein